MFAKPNTAGNELTRMSLSDHLADLQRRLILAFAGPLFGSLISLYFGRQIVAWLLKPLAQVLVAFNLPPQAYAFGVPTGFAVFVKVSIVCGLVLSSPWVCYQLWKFVEAGLYPFERKVVLIVAPFSAIMSTLGVLFLYYILLPICLAFMIFFTTSFPAMEVPPPGEGGLIQRLTGLTIRSSGMTSELEDSSNSTNSPITVPEVEPALTSPLHIPILDKDPSPLVEGQLWIKLPQRELRAYFGGRIHRFLPYHSQSIVQPLLDINKYINFVALLALGIIVAFQLPVVMLILSWSGFVNPQWLLKYRKYCVFACFTLGAVLTPADPLSMMVLALPLWLLYELGLVLMRMSYRPLPEEI